MRANSDHMGCAVGDELAEQVKSRFDVRVRVVVTVVLRLCPSYQFRDFCLRNPKFACFSCYRFTNILELIPLELHDVGYDYCEAVRQREKGMWENLRDADRPRNCFYDVIAATDVFIHVV